MANWFSKWLSGSNSERHEQITHQLVEAQTRRIHTDFRDILKKLPVEFRNPEQFGRGPLGQPIDVLNMFRTAHFVVMLITRHIHLSLQRIPTPTSITIFTDGDIVCDTNKDAPLPRDVVLREIYLITLSDAGLRAGAYQPQTSLHFIGEEKTKALARTFWKWMYDATSANPRFLHEVDRVATQGRGGAFSRYVNSVTVMP
jgi:hypothetical protein